MLTVKTETNVVSHNLRINTPGIEPSDILNGTTGSYFYINRPGSIGSVKGSIFFNLSSAGLDLIPSNAIINNLAITFNIEKTNSIGTFDNIKFKVSGTTLANIDATNYIPNTIQSTTFQTDQLFEDDIFKNSLEKYIFEIELLTEGSNQFRLHSIVFNITYTEMIATSLCKLMTKDGLVIIPLYNPISLPRYAMRIVTSLGSKSFDLIDTLDPAASPIRVMTPYGMKSIRMSLESPIINIFDPTLEKLVGSYFNNKGELVQRVGDVYKDITCLGFIEIEPSGVYDIYCTSSPFNINITIVEYDENEKILVSYEGVNALRVPMNENSKYVRVSITINDLEFTEEDLILTYDSIVITKS